MRGPSLLGLAALIPAALNSAQPAGAATVLLCTGDGTARSIELPLRPILPSRPGDEGCCVKGCHNGPSRKRGGTCHS